MIIKTQMHTRSQWKEQSGDNNYGDDDDDDPIDPYSRTLPVPEPHRHSANTETVYYSQLTHGGGAEGDQN